MKTGKEELIHDSEEKTPLWDLGKIALFIGLITLFACCIWKVIIFEPFGTDFGHKIVLLYLVLTIISITAIARKHSHAVTSFITNFSLFLLFYAGGIVYRITHKSIVPDILCPDIPNIITSPECEAEEKRVLIESFLEALFFVFI